VSTLEMSGAITARSTALVARVLSGWLATLPETLPQSLNRKIAHDSAQSSRHMPSDDAQIVRSHPMTAADFRRIVLSLEGVVEEYSHAGLPALQVGGGKLAWLASHQAVRKSDACAGAGGSVCGGGARDFLADPWRLGKGGTHAYSPGGDERGCTEGCTPNGVETAKKRGKRL
jgi:hypothetical protein